MKLYCTLLIVTAATAVATAAEPLFVPPGDYAFANPLAPEVQPLPEPQFGAPAPSFGGTLPGPQPLAQPPVVQSYPQSFDSIPMVSGAVVPLYPNVKVRSAHLAWPGGVSEVVQIPNPTPRAGCIDPVYVQICVPPGCPPTVTYGPRGQRVTYAFGGYRVQVTALRGVVTIDYDRRI